jgi:hypothetical protein
VVRSSLIANVKAVNLIGLPSLPSYSISKMKMIPKLITLLFLICQQDTFAFSSSELTTTTTSLPSASKRPPFSSHPHTPKTLISSNRNRYLSPCSTRLASVLPTKERLSDFLSTRGEQKRPEWGPDWMPTVLFNLRSSVQLTALLFVYIIHITVVCQHSIPLPIQLIPNERGHFQSIGLDT